MKKLISVALIAVFLMAGIGVAVAQQDMVQATNIPPAPDKATPDTQYGNTARAAIIGERLSQESDGNANVYINEGSVITVSVYLLKDAGANDLTGTMANFTYMVYDLYSTMADKGNTNILLKVYDTSKNTIIDAKFNAAKNAFDYFNVAAESQQQPSQGTGQYQSGMQQQPGQQYSQGMQQPRAGRMA